MNFVFDVLSFLNGPIPAGITRPRDRFLVGLLQWFSVILIISVGAAIALGILLGFLEALSLLGDAMD